MENSESTSDSVHRPWESYHTVYTNAKAGMEGVDKEKVQRIVYEMSKGSKYFENEQRKEAVSKQKVELMRTKCAKLTPEDISHYQKVVQKRIFELEATRDLSRIWMHVDLDAFYAAVETLANPSLKGKPMAVGGLSMISTANYEARKYGVRAAMPGFIARKLCPGLIFVPTDFKKYTHYSDLARKVFGNYDPNFIAASLDEAYLDITDVCKERGCAGEEMAEELRSSVYDETGLTCSAGVAPNRLLAKVCSDINKPNGQFVLPNDRMAVMTFISSLPIRKIGGIGKVTESILKDAFGINACEELLQKGHLLYALFSHSAADFFVSVGLGLGKTDAPQVRSRKSISTERTFSATDNEALLFQKLAEIAEILSADMQKEGLCAKTLTLKLKTASFEIRTRAVTLHEYVCSSKLILQQATKLLRVELPVSLRLIGLRMSQFNEEKVTAPDPTQKAITNFMVSRDSSRNKPDSRHLWSSEVREDDLTNDAETSISLDIHEIFGHDFMDLNECMDNRDIDHDDSFTRNNADEANGNQEHGSNAVNDPACAYHSSTLTGTDGPAQVIETDHSGFRKHENNNLGLTSSSNTLEREAISLSPQMEPLEWVDDYKCSLCGIQLPLDFVQERQEHYDFHVAERLQKEESCYNSRSPMLRQRVVEEASQSKRKKRKPSPKQGKHLSIDMFFAKSNQNF